MSYNRKGLALATNPAGKVLQFSPGQRSEEWLFADAFEHAPDEIAALDRDERIAHALAYLLGEAVHEIGNALTPLMINTQLIVEQSTAGEISDSAHVIFDAARRIALTLRRLRGLKDLQSLSYLGQARMLDLRKVAPPNKAE